MDVGNNLFIWPEGDGQNSAFLQLSLGEEEFRLA